MYDFSTDDGLSGVLDAFESGGFAGVETLYSDLLLGGGDPLVWGDGSDEARAVDDALAMDGIFGPPSNLADPNNTATTGMDSNVSGLLKTAEKWLKDNPNLAKLGLSGLAGLAGAYQANKSGQNSIESLREQEAIADRKRQRIADSITGMVPFAANAAGPLTRINGQRVFGDDGRILR